jgi:hypothetical protein
MRRVSATLAWGLWGVTLALFAGVLYLAFGTDTPPEVSSASPVLLAMFIFVVSYASVGMLVASRQPSNPIGWLAGGTGFMYSLAGFLLLYSGEGLAPDPRPGAEVLFQLSSWMWLVGIVLGGPLLILFFPTGTLLSTRWRHVVTILVVGTSALVFSITFLPGPPEPGTQPNPMGLQDAGSLLEAVAAGGAVLVMAGSVLAAASVAVRYRRAPAVQRQQLKLFLFALAVAAAVALLVGFVLEPAGLYELSTLLITIALSLIPISMGVAILRHRIIDIDVVINKALVYAALTSVLAAGYLGSVVLLQRALAPVTRDSDLAVAASTLAVAGLFRPLLKRLQAFIDRQFYRRKYDATETLGAFSARLRDQVDLDALGRDLVDVVGTTMQPAHASLWLRDGAAL